MEIPSKQPEVTTMEFVCRDTGIGMSEEFRQHIFEAFTREETSTVSGVQGTGLGMAITKNIVDMTVTFMKIQEAFQLFQPLFSRFYAPFFQMRFRMIPAHPKQGNTASGPE